MKVVVCNFENLIDEEGAISTKTMLLIDKLRRKKCKFIITTNRFYEEILEYNKSYPFIDYAFFYNGSLVIDLNKNKALVKKYFTTKEIKDISNGKDVEKYCYLDKVYQIKVKNKLYTKNNNIKEVFEKIIKSDNITIIGYQDSDYALFSPKSNNYILTKKKDIPNKDVDYILEEDINNILEKL